MSGSGAGDPPAWGLSPLRSESPGSPPPTTPGVRYRSFFATECEAIAFQLGRPQSRALPTPLQRASTVEAERLTPLEGSATCSFLGAPTPSPAEEQASQEAGPPPAPASPHNLTYDADALLEDHPRQTGVRVCFGASTPGPSTESFFPPPPKEEQEATRLPRKSTARPETAGGAVAKRKLPLWQKPLPEKKSSLSKLPSKRKPPLSLQPPSGLSRGPGLRTGLAQPGTKLSVGAAGSTKVKKKSPLKRRLVQAPTPPQQQSTSELSHPGKNHSEKPPSGVLLDAGQITSSAVVSTPPCAQCRLLAEENQRLRSTLEEYEQTIPELKRKKPAKDDWGSGM